ncbi:MAG: membrane protein insertase YidC [Opitutales bacterium]
MDKKHALLGTLFILAALGFMVVDNMQRAKAAEEAAREQEQRAVEQDESPGADDGDPATPASFVRETTIQPSEETADGFVQEVRERLESDQAEETVVLQNRYLRATLTSLGAAIRTVALIEEDANGQLAYPVEIGGSEPIVLHELAKTRPLVLAREVRDGFAPIALPFAIVEQASDRVVFESTLPEGLVLRRVYTVAEREPGGPDDYTIRHELTISNPTDRAFELDEFFINIGTAAPTNADPYGMDLNASAMVDGDFKNIRASKFKGGFFSSAKEEVTREGAVTWGAVKNQFFASILTPDTPAGALVARPVQYPTPSEARSPSIGVTGFMQFDLPTLAAGAQETIAFDYYSGPKDFNRLQKMTLDQEDVMQFGWFLGMFLGFIAFVGKALFTLLSFLYGLMGNWGFAIIFMTLIVRLFLWPLTAKAARSSKRMQELQKPMAELKEKYKDNPQKQQQATLELFKKHKINPFSSCWPVLLQFPIFIAMFNLLRNTADLRFAGFLWIDDLSMPDASIPLGGASLPFIGGAINVLPFVWLVSMWFQMKMMPQPSVDNAQTKIIKYMPFIFFPMTYFFSSGLVLYWTTTNAFSIFQGWVTRRTKDAEDIAIEAEIAEEEKKKSSVLKTGPISKKKKKKN